MPLTLGLDLLIASTWLIFTLHNTPGAISTGCPFPDQIDNGHATITGHHINDTLSYYCSEGFWYNGTNPRLCTRGGIWSGQAGYCEASPECKEMDPPEHGGILPLDSSYKGRPLIEASCWPGYIYMGSPYLMCVGNNTWNDTLRECVEVARNRCKELKPKKHLVIDYEKLARKEAVYIYCKTGYTYNGSDTMTCEKDGSWSGVYGSCNEKNVQQATARVSYIIGIVISAVTIFTIAISIVIVRKKRSAHTKVQKLPAFRHLYQVNKTIVLDNLIDPAKVSMHKLIGKGQYGEVYRGSLKKRKSDKNPQNVALKSLKIAYNQRPDDLNEFITEATTMKGFNHPNVLKLMGITFIVARLYVVLPFMKNGDLRGFIRKNPFNQVKAIGFLYDIVKGMCYLASMKFVHRDLAARNCMVNDNERIVIGDFGLTRDIYHNEYYRPTQSDKPVPIKWMAIESLESGLYTTMSDIWSFGVLAWEIYTRGWMPYPHVSIAHMKRYLQDGGRLHRPDSCPPVIYATMEKCWEIRPEDRPPFRVLSTTIEYFVQHPDELQPTSPNPALTLAPAPAPTPPQMPTPIPSTSIAVTAPLPPPSGIVLSGYANRAVVDSSNGDSSSSDNSSRSSSPAIPSDDNSEDGSDEQDAAAKPDDNRIIMMENGSIKGANRIQAKPEGINVGAATVKPEDVNNGVATSMPVKVSEDDSPQKPECAKSDSISCDAAAADLSLDDFDAGYFTPLDLDKMECEECAAKAQADDQEGKYEVNKDIDNKVAMRSSQIELSASLDIGPSGSQEMPSIDDEMSGEKQGSCLAQDVQVSTMSLQASGDMIKVNQLVLKAEVYRPPTQPEETLENLNKPKKIEDIRRQLQIKQQRPSIDDNVSAENQGSCLAQGLQVPTGSLPASGAKIKINQLIVKAEVHRPPVEPEEALESLNQTKKIEDIRQQPREKQQKPIVRLPTIKPRRHIEAMCKGKKEAGAQRMRDEGTVESAISLPSVHSGTELKAKEDKSKIASSAAKQKPKDEGGQKNDSSLDDQSKEDIG